MPSAREFAMPSGQAFLVPRTETWSSSETSKPGASIQPRSKPTPKYQQPRAEVLKRSSLPKVGGYRSRNDDSLPEASDVGELLTAIPDFYISVDRSEGKSLGIEVVTDGTLVVMSINEGLIQDWNTANPDQAIEEQDLIVEANGISGDVDVILEQCRATQPLKLKVRRPAFKAKQEMLTEIEYSIKLDRREGAKLGIDVEHDRAKSLLIEAIDAVGLVAVWNRANPSKQVQVEDRIIEVNGVRGEPQQLLDMCMESVMLEMKLVRDELKDP